MARLKVTPDHRAYVRDVCAITGLLAFSVAAAQHHYHWNPYLPAAAAAAAGIFAGIWVFVTTDDARLGQVTAAWGPVLAAWLVPAARRGPWNWHAFLTLVLACAALGAITLVAYARHKDQQAAAVAAGRRHGPYQPFPTSSEQQRWRDLLARLPGSKGLAEPLGIHERGHGSTDIYYSLPADGSVTVRDIAARHDNLLTALAPRITDLDIRQGRHARELILRIAARPPLRREIPLPSLTELRARGAITINGPLPLGETDDGKPYTELLRELSALLIGITGAGKSTAINTLIAVLSQCPDTIIWLIDMKGRLAGPWLRPWVDGESAGPVIDWVATTREEAWRMLEAAVTVRKTRSASMHGGSMMVPDPDHPQLVLIVDESSDLFSDEVAISEQTHRRNWEYRGLALPVARACRSEAEMLILATQRAIVGDVGGGTMKSQCALRWALPCVSEANAAHVLEDDARLARRLTALSGIPGAGIRWRMGEPRADDMRWYRTDPALQKPHGRHDLARITEYAGAYTARSFEPDVVTALGGGYESRWKADRCPVLLKLYKESPAAQARLAALAASQERSALAVRERERTGERQRAEDAERQRQDELAEFDRMMSAEYGRPAGRADAEQLLLAWIADHGNGPLGVSVGEMLTELKRRGAERHRSTVYRWMERRAADGTLEQVTPGRPTDGTRYRIAGRWA